MTERSPFRNFKTSPEITCLAVMLSIRFPLFLRIVEDFLYERGIEVRHETVRYRLNRFGPMIAVEIRAGRIKGDARPSPLAVAAGPGPRQDQRDGALPLSRGRTRGRGAAKHRHQDPGS